MAVHSDIQRSHLISPFERVKLTSPQVSEKVLVNVR